MASNLETTKKAYELFKQGDISTLVKRHYRRNMYVDYHLALRTNCLGRASSRGGKRLQISSRESLRVWVLLRLRHAK
jgi:hypothetical protein